MMRLPSRRLSLVAGLVGLVGFFVLSVVSLKHDHDVAQERATAEVKNMSRLMEQHTAATIRSIDMVLRDIQGHVQASDFRDHPVDGRNQALNVLLAEKKQALPEVHGLHVINAQGDFIYSSVQPVPRINMGDRWHFIVQREDPEHGLAISEPVVGRTTGQWTMAFTRRLSNPDGSFAGVVAATFLPNSFEPYYRTLNVGDHGSVSIRVEDDGVGMDLRALEAVNARLASGEGCCGVGYGIFNVNERLRLEYGEPWGLRYERHAGGGLRAELLFPLRTEGGSRGV